MISNWKLFSTANSPKNLVNKCTCNFCNDALSYICNKYIWKSVLTECSSVVQISAKYPLPQMWQTLRKQFLEASDWFTAYNRGKVFMFLHLVLT